MKNISIRNKYGEYGFHYDKSEKKRKILREKMEHFDQYGNDARNKKNIKYDKFLTRLKEILEENNNKLLETKSVIEVLALDDGLDKEYILENIETLIKERILEKEGDQIKLK